MSHALQHGPGQHTPDGLRIPAREIETTVTTHLARALDDPLALLTQAGIPLDSDHLRIILAKTERLANSVRRKQRDVISDLVDKVVVHPREIIIQLSIVALCRFCSINPIHSPDSISLTVPVRLTRTGRAPRLIQRDGRSVTQGKPDLGLIALLRKARNWWQQLQTGTSNIATIAREEKVNDSWVSRIVRLNFLAPAIVEAILSGTQPASVSATSLRTAKLPIDWDEQITMFGM